MIDSAVLLDDLRQVVARLTDDLRERASEPGPVRDVVLREYSAAKAAGRTAQSENAWREDLLVQGAVAWGLSSVFVRFLEDGHLVDDVWLSGPGARREVARGRRRAYFAEHPTETDREVLWAAFRTAASLPAAAPLFDVQHNLVWQLPISGDAAREVIQLWDRIDADAADLRLRHDFTDPKRDTRFLGDLYQDVSDDARDKYALVQTPEFIEQFILDRTLDPALAEFGLDRFQLIDPTCGSGHFLIGAFRRLFAAWQDREPGTPAAELAARALDSVYGVDVNPYAVAIARFRLVIEALNACGIRRLVDAPAWEVRVACGDSLLHGPESGQLSPDAYGAALARKGIEHHYVTEDAAELTAWLSPGYHAVVGNPPYITARDPALNAAYRDRFSTCKGKYQLTVPFMERFFELAYTDDGRGGWVGQITGNAFMRREFGTKLVEDFFPTVDLQTVVDTSPIALPGHGTPTVILVGRARKPVLQTVRAALSVRGDNGPPDGPLWQALAQQVDRPGSESGFVSALDAPRELFLTHPWSLAGGGVAELRARLEKHPRLETLGIDMGFFGIPGADEIFVRSRRDWDHLRVGSAQAPSVTRGDEVRHWAVIPESAAYFPYTSDGTLIEIDSGPAYRALYPWRTVLWARPTFSNSTYREEGRSWYEWHQLASSRIGQPCLVWGEVASHNHFSFHRGDGVISRTAPLLRLIENASEARYFELAGPLNSSTACFWLRAVCQPKSGDPNPWERRYGFNASNVRELPLPSRRGTELPAELHRLAALRQSRIQDLPALLEDRIDFDEAARSDADDFARMISLQEELDWEVLAAYGLAPDELRGPGCDAPSLALGERAFEIALARRLAGREVESAWFKRHGATPRTDLPDHWPATYREVVERRIELISNDRDVGLIERPECKRRWNQSTWRDRERTAMRTYLLDRVEELPDWQRGSLMTCAQVTDRLRGDHRIELAAQRFAGVIDADLETVLTELIEEESVPYLAARRHTETGLRKREEWEQVWELQRREDAGEVINELPVPPKYGDKDWLDPRAKQLRGKLDVPNERFASVPDGQRTGDPSPLVGWAGWDHPTRAFALASRITLVRNEDGAGPDRLIPLLAGLLELLPWVRQWHPDPDPGTGQPPHVELEGFLTAELARLGKTRDELGEWRPPRPHRSDGPRKRK